MQDTREELIEQFGETYGYVRRLARTEIEYYKLTAAESSAKAASAIATALVALVLGLFIIIFALVTLGLGLAALFGEVWLGFAAVTLLLIIILVVILLLRKPLIANPTVKKVISMFFKHDGQEV